MEFALFIKWKFRFQFKFPSNLFFTIFLVNTGKSAFAEWSFEFERKTSPVWITRQIMATAGALKFATREGAGIVSVEALNTPRETVDLVIIWLI